MAGLTTLGTSRRRYAIVRESREVKVSRKPNLVFIFSDQQRYDTMRCYGNSWIRTPSLNALADRSFVFERVRE